MVGVVVQATMRPHTMEPLSARPFAYLRTGLTFGVIISYWDYFRRTMLEHVLEREEKLRYYKTLQAVNQNLRIGDEDDLSNLTEYLAGSTTRV